jgi:hypothetical protein
MNPQVREALHVVGYLLETNATSHREARTIGGEAVAFNHRDACKWCLSGALNVVSKHLKVDDVKVFIAAAKHLSTTNCKYTRLSTMWDFALDSTRKEIVQKLKDV